MTHLAQHCNHERDMMSQAELSEEVKNLIFDLFDEGLKPKAVSNEVDVPYEQICLQRRYWKLKQRGFNTWKEYRNYLAKRYGFDSYSAYRKYLNQGSNIHPKVVDIITRAGITEIFGEEIVTTILKEFELFRIRVGLKGRKLRVVTAAITYGILRKQRKVKTMTEIAEHFGIRRRDLNRAYNTYTTITDIPLQEVNDFIQRGCEVMNLSDDVKQHADNFCKENNDIFRRMQPQVAAAICLFIQSHKRCEWRTKKEVGKALGVHPKRIEGINRKLKRSGRI